MGLWVHVSDTREHRLYAREASRAPSRELKRVSAPKSYSVQSVQAKEVHTPAKSPEKAGSHRGSLVRSHPNRDCSPTRIRKQDAWEQAPMPTLVSYNM